MRIEPLIWREQSVLLLVYRPSLLESALADEQARAFLMERAYCLDSVDAALESLRDQVRTADRLSRVKGYGVFLHEVGAFLGYPIDDVRGFIEHEGRDFKCMGMWQVYGNVPCALACFDHYGSCINAYLRLFDEGARLEDLAALAELRFEGMNVVDVHR